MHWVDRGTEPAPLANVRASYTSGWVQHYRHGVGSRPTDAHWRQFHPDLKRVFSGLCAYCEEITKGEVDHLRPKSKFPELVYSWSNWLFACHECNHAKGSTWPDSGYVDPCAISGPGRPEHYFVYDTVVGFILPNPSLSSYHRLKAQKTIDALGLNESHHLKNRVQWLELLLAVVPKDPTALTSRTKNILGRLASREAQFSSLVLAWLSERGYAS